MMTVSTATTTRALGLLAPLALIAIVGSGAGDVSAARSPVAPAQVAGSWTQWGGPQRNFVVPAAGRLAESWPESGPPVTWSRPLGTGHSAIVAADGRLFTMYRVGNGRGRQGPWEAEEAVIALDAATGRTLWEHKYPSRREDFSFGAGPHSTPLVVDGRVFTVGTNQQMFAFDAATGGVLWSHDFIKEFDAPELLLRPVVKTGYGCSPIAFRDLVICSVGGPGQSVMAFRQRDGAVVWKTGDFLTSAAAPILIEFGGRPHLVFLAGGSVMGLDPETGAILWAHPHDPGNDLNCSTPLWGPDNILFLSSAYKAGSRAIRLRQDAGVTHAEEIWFTSRVRFMFLSALRVGDFVYGTTGDFGPAFLTALDIKTGEAAWQHRGFARASLLHADGKTIVMDEDGDLALTRLTPEGATVLAQAKIFDTVSWTVPTLVGTTLYARDREKIVALALGAAASSADPRDTPPAPAPVSAGVTSRPSPPPVRVPAPAVLAGTWQLETPPGAASGAAPFLGLVTAGAPRTLHITQPANGDVIVESSNNEGHARFYRPGSTTTTLAGPGGAITMRASWAGRSLTAAGTFTPGAGSARSVTESISIDAAAARLTVEIASREGADPSTAPATSRFVYVRQAKMGPCESWTVACKRF